MTVAHHGTHEADLPSEVAHLHPDPAKWLDPESRHRLVRQLAPDYVERFAAEDPLFALRYPAFLLDPEIQAEVRRFTPEVALYTVPRAQADSYLAVHALRGIAHRIVGISSMDVYRAYGRIHRREPGPPDPVPLSEEAPLREQLFPDQPGVEKILAERVLLGEPALPGTMLRWPMVYGPRDPLHRLFGYLRQMDAGRPTIMLEAGRARWGATRGYAGDVAFSAVLAATNDRAAGRIYNVGELDAVTEAEWVRAVGRAAGWRGEVVVIPPEDAPAHLVPQIDTDHHWVVDTARIRAELGYAEGVVPEEALRRTVTWERANPPPADRVPSEQEMHARYAAEDALLRRRVARTVE